MENENGNIQHKSKNAGSKETRSQKSRSQETRSQKSPSQASSKKSRCKKTGSEKSSGKEAGSKKARSQKSRGKTGWKRYSGRVVLSRKGGLFIYPPFFLFPSKIVAAARISASGVWTF